MEKIARFKDIPQFTTSGNWQCDFEPVGLIKFIDEQVSEEGLQLNPKFQRGHVWSSKQQIAYIEYFLKGGKSGTVIYLNKPDWNINMPVGEYNEFVCVDGLQRITAFRRFINNEIKIFDSYFREYTDKLRMKFTIKVNINDLKSEKEVLQWYVDMNAGGTPHTSDEIEKVRKMIQELG